MCVTAEELNILIARHLQESSFSHTAYIFRNEAMVEDDDLDIPPQALVSILQKGMLYMQLEKGINERALTDHNPESIINSIINSVHNQEPVHVPKPSPKPKQVHNPPPPPPPAPARPPQIAHLPSTSATIFRKHNSEVFCGSWTPEGDLFATASADATAIIWDFSKPDSVKTTLLDHATQQDRTNKDVVSLAWNNKGTILATGCNDGTARLWTNKGDLKFVLGAHCSVVFAVQFSPDGNYLLTGSKDSNVIVWNVATGQQKQVFSFSQPGALDVDWLDNTMFAASSGFSSGSGDNNNVIMICSIGQSKPLVLLEGHTKDINKISWHTRKRYLASCSDDKTVRVWRPFDKNPSAAIVFGGHTNEVYTIKWVPGEGPPRLASGSFDCTIRVWDVERRSCLYVINKHTEPIFAVGFSPRGQFFASGANDMSLNIFRTRDGAQVGRYDTTGGIFDAVWNPRGGAIAICETDSSLAILPTSLFPECTEICE